VSGELGDFEQSLKNAEVHFFIFPHLKDFLVLDVRKNLPGRPRVYTSSTQEIFSEEFYRQLEEQISFLLRRQGQPFADLMSLPQDIETTVRDRVLEQMLTAINIDDPGLPIPQVSILLCGPWLLDLSPKLMAETLESLFEAEPDQSLLLLVTQEMERLIAEERIQSEASEQRRMGNMILGENSDFLTLWENSQ
jgi:hypothetical protein